MSNNAGASPSVYGTVNPNRTPQASQYHSLTSPATSSTGIESSHLNNSYGNGPEESPVSPSLLSCENGIESRCFRGQQYVGIAPNNKCNDDRISGRTLAYTAGGSSNFNSLNESYDECNKY